MQADGVCERDQTTLVTVQANQDPRTYPLLNTELDGRYHLIGGLGQGGVGTVYLANHIHLDQLSAVKFLDVDMLGEVDEEQREESLQDFVKEAKLAMMLRHDYVVRVMDYGVHERCPFLVMEYVPGPSLLRRMNAGERFSVDQCINVITRLAEALSAFHDRKLVHRDLKPANVILDPRDNGDLTLVDLGLVKDLSNEARSSTHPLALRGTPGYLAPEQVPSWVLSSAGADVTGEKQPVDTRVDIFALGVLAFELLSGQTPYPKGMSPTKVIVYTCTMPTPDLPSICPEVQVSHPWFVKLVMDMMAKRPADRPLDAREVLDRIETAREMHLDEATHTNQVLDHEIQRATQALVDHVKSTPLASSSGLISNTPPALKSNQPPSVTPNGILGRAPMMTPQGSLIPPPASLRRPSGQVSVESLGLTEESTLHFDATLGGERDGTIDEPVSEFSLSGETEALDLRGVADRPLPYRVKESAFIHKEEQDFTHRPLNHENNSKVFWIGVVLVSAIVGGASVLFTKQSPPPTQKKFILGSAQDKPRTRQSKSFVDPIPKNTGHTEKRPEPIRLGTYEPPRLRQPTKADDAGLNRDPGLPSRSPQTSQNGVIEVEVKNETPQPSVSKRRVKRSPNTKAVKKRSSSKKSNSKGSKPLSKRQYKLLKLQVENLLRNQRLTEARRKLMMVRKRLRPSDEFYMEINMLLDSISP